MQNKILLSSSVSLCVMVMGGCDTIRDETYSIFNDRAQTVGASELIDEEAFETIYLPDLLYMEILSSGKELSIPRPTDPKIIGPKIDQAFSMFNTKYGTDTAKYRRLRNSVQDRIVAASVQRCDFYKRYLKRVDQSVNVVLGSLATITGAAGAIVTGVSAARALAGTAGILSGLRAQANEDMFASLAIHAITNGIDAKRSEIQTAYLKKRKDEITAEPYSYTVEAAVADALEFHGACNLVTGLQAAGAAAERKSNPGLVEVEAILKKYNDVEREIAKFIAARVQDKNGNSDGASPATSPQGAIIPPTTLVPAVPSGSVVVTPDDG